MNDSSQSGQGSLVIIFYRNPELGKVKTRLAKTIGEEMALAIYLKLSSHTRQIIEQLKIDKAVYYSHFADTEDHWPNELYHKAVQQGNDLGEKMCNALAEAFARGYQRVCVIGTDCLELTPSIMDTAFFQLEKFDAIIGPARDGGYYLLGMKKLFPEVFQNKAWSTNTVAGDTIADFKKLGLRYFCLDTLGDVDEEKDLPDSMRAGR
jgi:rSAM/selenodomain-associated transferase 1